MNLKVLTLAAAGLALPALIASAQTPATTSGQSAFVPLFGSNGGGTGGGTNGGGGGTTSGNSTWYIDTARNLIVLCTQNAGGGTGAQAFTCNAQTIQTVQTPTAPGTTGQGGAGTGTGGTGTGATGSAPPSGASGAAGTGGSGT